MLDPTLMTAVAFLRVHLRTRWQLNEAIAVFLLCFCSLMMREQTKVRVLMSKQLSFNS
jgi:hypothetical protein